MLADNDWRLDGQEQYLRKFLRGAEIRFKIWLTHDDGRDHDHCEFCWAKIWDRAHGTEEYDHAYVTVDDRHWICEPCFADFKDRFEFHESAC